MPEDDWTYLKENWLLASLPPQDFSLVGPHLEDVDLPWRMQLDRANRDIDFVYFLDSGIASVVAADADEKSAEVGIVGREGFTGLAVVLGASRAPHETFMQLGGRGRRISAANLLSAMTASPRLRRMLLLFAHCFHIQTAETALANGRSKLVQRLTRWLLMARDRADGNELPFTHEFLATMLCAPRPGVTKTINELQADGLIKANRGGLTILNREGLERISNGGYGVAEGEYVRLLGPL